MSDWSQFRTIWIIDFEFYAPDGGRPVPHCLVAHEERSGRRIRLWRDQFGAHPPYDVGPESLCIAYAAQAEWSCHLALGWPLPVHSMCLMAEARCWRNGWRYLFKQKLTELAAELHVPGVMDGKYKEDMQSLAMRGTTFSPAEQQELPDYCESDVALTVEVFRRLQPFIKLIPALVRGRYATAIAEIEAAGIPIDTIALQRIRGHWHPIQRRIVSRLDTQGFYDDLDLQSDRFFDYALRQGVKPLRTSTGRWSASKESFAYVARVLPELQAQCDLRDTLGKMRVEAIAVGADGRHRANLWPFSSKTSRNQPSSTKFIFNAASWLRDLILPDPGTAVVYLDWAQQEFGIGAALSGDAAMAQAYLSGDPYMAFAKQVGAVPSSATKQTHGTIRRVYKECILAMQYGMGAQSFAKRIQCSMSEAEALLRQHRRTYAQFWRWLENTIDTARLRRIMQSRLGWTIRPSKHVSTRTLMNFPMQSAGASLLLWAICLGREQDIKIIAPVHDAIMIEAPLPALDEVIQTTQAVMQQASEALLDGFPLRTECDIARYPDHYHSGKGEIIWEEIAKVTGPILTSPASRSME